MSNPYNSGDTVGRGDMEETVDTGGVQPGQVAGNQFANTGDNLVGDRGAIPTDEELEDTRDRLDELGIERELTDEQQEYLEEQVEQAVLRQEQAEQRAAEERAKDEAREEAHANEEAFYEGETTVENVVFEDGDYVVVEEVGYEWSLPDGTTIIVDENGDAISVEWPEGEGPVYIGDVLVGGEPHAVYQLPTGAQIVVDEEGNTIGTLDEVDVDDMSVPLYWITGDKTDAGEMVTVEVVPDPDGSYDTLVVDAETGEVLKDLDTGSEALGYNVGQTGTDGQEIYQTYVPPGSDYYIVIDADGNVVGTHPLPEDPEWSVLGIVEYYEGGEVVVDVGVAEVSVDVVGPDGGISVDLDVLLVEGTAGIEWNEDGSWDFDVSAEVDVGGADVGVDVGFGQDAAGMWHVDVETSLEMQIGVLSLSGGQEAHFQQTDDGFEMSFGFEGRVGAFGAYVERSQDLSIVVDDDGTALTYSDMIGAGIAGVGGVQVVGEAQVRVDEDGVEGATGAYGRIVDGDGVEVVGAGAYLDSEEGGYFSDQQLDDRRDYERQYGDADRPPALGGDAQSRGQEDADRFGLAGQEGEEDLATGRVERLRLEERPDGIHDIHMNQGVQGGQEGEEDLATGRVERIGVEERPDGIHGMETGFGARARSGADGGESPEVPPAVAEALAGRFAEHGSNVDHLLGQTEGSNWRMRGDDDALMRPSFGEGAIEPEGFSDKGNQAAGVTLPGVGKVEDEYIGETEKNLDGHAGEPEGVTLPNIGKIDDGRDADSIFVPGRTYSVSDDPPEGAQLASDPPPSEDDTDDTPPAERPKIFQRRDGEAKTPDDEEPVPTPTPRPRDEWPEIATERLRDADEDGDGVPDRWGTDGPIRGDDVDLDDITGAPPIRQTADATADQSAGGIERPDDARVHADAGPEHSEGTIERPDTDFDDTSGAERLIPVEVADDVTGVWTDMRPLAATDQAEAAEEPVPMRDADRGQLSDDSADGMRTGIAAELADDIAPVAPVARPAATTEPDPVPVEPEQVESAVPGFQALPELDAAIGQAPEAESVAQVETAIPAFLPELDDEVVVAVEIDVTASLVELADGESDDLMTDASTMEFADRADDQIGEG